MLWDLVHDRAHSHGDLPFDPFMIRQRMPYWMYSLEELRCDLTAFGEAMALEREGFAFARHVQYAILFDRLFRFPVTGTRVRNYDGLGGQLLFAYLHRHGHRALDRQPPDDRVGRASPTASRRCARRSRRSTATGIDRSKLAQWGAAHDLVAHLRPGRDGLARGPRRGARLRRGRGPAAATSTTSCPTSSRCRCSTRAQGKLEPALGRPPARAARLWR